MAVIGAYCELAAVIDLKDLGLTLLLFAGFSVIFHGVIIILVGGFIYRDWEMIAIVSQANVGGSTTAIALAESFNRKEHIICTKASGEPSDEVGSKHAATTSDETSRDEGPRSRGDVRGAQAARRAGPVR